VLVHGVGLGLRHVAHALDLLVDGGRPLHLLLRDPATARAIERLHPGEQPVQEHSVVLRLGRGRARRRWGRGLA
jgi:hypothetical protein